MLVCSNCGGREIVTDDKLGHTVCAACGTVLESDRIVAEVGFSENAKGAQLADGFTLHAGN